MRILAMNCLFAMLCVFQSFAVAADEAQSLHGTVYSAEGFPAPGAIVWAARFSHGPLERKETLADKEGRYMLSLEPGAWYVWARLGSQGGEGPVRHEQVEVLAGQSPQPVTIFLEERGTLRGRLLEAETGKPIVGGRLFLDAAVVLTTDRDGRFEVGGLVRDNHEAFVVAAGRQRMRVLFDTTARFDTELEVSVPCSGKIVGRVTDENGKPIPGAYVGRATSGTFFSINGLYLACDAAGRFEYDDAVTPGQPTRLMAGAPGFGSQGLDDLLVPADGKPLELSIVLRPLPAKRPAVTDEKHRVVSGIVRGLGMKPAEGVLVRWAAPKSTRMQVRTDAEGRFRLTTPDVAGELAILPKGFLPQFPEIAAGDQMVEISLKAGRTVRGHVLDDTSLPIRNVRVTPILPIPGGREMSLPEVSIRTDAAGYFELKGVSDDVRLQFEKHDLKLAEKPLIKVDRDDNVVTMLHGGAVQGRVIDKDGKPIRSFRVLVGFPRERLPDDKPEGFFAGYSGIGVRFTADDGRFVLSGVGADSVYRIKAIAEGHGEAVADRVQALPLNRLGAVEPVTLRAGTPTALRVRAVSPRDKPVSGARVTLVDGEPTLDHSFSWGYDDASWEDMARGRTNDNGWADFPKLSFSGATLVVRASGYARHRVPWRNGERELTVKMTPEAVITAELRDSEGRPLRECHVLLSSGGHQISAGVGPDDKGRLRVAELPAGTWTINFHDAAGKPILRQVEATLTAGQTKDLKVD